jgi:hypothetical protein
MTETHDQMARRLIASGYRAGSNRYRIVSRIDREDWKEHMARKHAPWSFEEGMRWVIGLGDERAADHYRRVYTKDKIEGVPEEVYRAVKRAGNGAGWGGLSEYRPLLPVGAVPATDWDPDALERLRAK